MGAVCAAAGAQTQQQTPAQPKPAQEANPFPGDNADAPVIPTDLSTAAPADDAIDYGKVVLADPNTDPVRSPDDTAPEPAAAAGGSSSSSAGIDQLIQAPPEPERKGRHKKDDDEDTAAQAPKQVGPAEDEQVGAYYLETKNWKGALSRFESALVLDPENPDVYWGLGEAQRHLGRFGEAKVNYRKLVEYDPDSKHGKEAKRLLKTPELENAPAVSSAAGAPAQQP
jgi:tetratricopeptide (TPR) repeat protein